MKISKSLKLEIERIAAIENMFSEDLIHSFINTGMDQYWRNGSLRSNAFDWAEFRKKIKVGDEVLTNGVFGTIVARNGDVCKIRICKGVEVDVLVSTISDKKRVQSKSD
jgi:hypothetical protein